MPYFTQRLVDDFASHIRLYRRAMEKAKATANKEGEKILFLCHYLPAKVCVQTCICILLVDLCSYRAA